MLITTDTYKLFDLSCPGFVDVAQYELDTSVVHTMVVELKPEDESPYPFDEVVNMRVMSDITENLEELLYWLRTYYGANIMSIVPTWHDRPDGSTVMRAVIVYKCSSLDSELVEEHLRATKAYRDMLSAKETAAEQARQAEEQARHNQEPFECIACHRIVTRAFVERGYSCPECGGTEYAPKKI